MQLKKYIVNSFNETIYQRTDVKYLALDRW